jgi:hypothetical protein
MLVNNSDNHKNICEFAEDSILYLYGEMGEAQIAEFRSHLNNCSSCAEELNAFSSIHFSIQNWKTAEFDNLATPEIKIPMDSRQKSGIEVSVLSSWLTNLRGRFSFSFGWIQAGAFAALLICLAFGLYLMTYSDQREHISEKKENQTTIETTPKLTDKTPEIAKSEPDSKNDDEINKIKESKPVEHLISVQAEEKNFPNKKAAAAKIFKNRKNSEDHEKAPKPSPNRKIKAPEIYANVTPVNDRNLPKLNNLPEEADDDDLRLADLFNELDEG